MTELVLWLDQLRMSDLAKVGGKNASLGEMIGNLAKLGVSVPGGFATTAEAFRGYLEKSGLADKIRKRLATLDVEDVGALAAAGKEIRGWIVDTRLPDDLEQAIREAYGKLCDEAAGVASSGDGRPTFDSRDPGRSQEIAVAVRSSATAEDLPDASFAGQQETYLNVTGIEDVL
ncbi:MAG: PEP/pyruvate-binding domain-containing protein, partial [Rhodanobacteraceae bacterium]